MNVDALAVGILAIDLNRHLKGLSEDEVLEVFDLVQGAYCTHCGRESEDIGYRYGCTCMRDD